MLAKYLLLDSKNVILDLTYFGILEIHWNIHVFLEILYVNLTYVPFHKYGL